MSYSFRSIVDGSADSDVIYYNASIIGTQTRDAGGPDSSAVVKFNESRDAPIVRNAENFEFSIIRFSMNGPNKNLPLFIPVIQTNGFAFPFQGNPDLTVYYVSVPYQRTWAYTDIFGLNRTRTFTIAPGSTPLVYRSETVNTAVAPRPLVPALGITRQDLSSRYYWVYTYKHMVDLVNETIQNAMQETFNTFRTTWLADATIATAFPYASFNAFLADHDSPIVKYNEDTQLFEIYGDTRAFNVATQLDSTINPVTGLPTGTNVPIPAFVAPVVPVPPLAAALPQSAPYLRLFFNSNLYGLFCNFKNTYFNATTGSPLLFPLTPLPITIPTGPAAVTPTLYTNEILFTNENYTNILNNNPTLQGSNAVPPPAFNPYFLIPPTKQHLYWVVKQDYGSTSSLWSPIAAIVFTSTLLPVKNEYTASPLLLGNNNVTGSSASTAAFQPIITDFVIDQQYEKAHGWRDFTLYEPSAEYRMVSMQSSHDEIRNIDIQAFWKYRLTGELIPLTMFNTSDVNIKMMFRKKDYKA